jgi:hypothetical protein
MVSYSSTDITTLLSATRSPIGPNAAFHGRQQTRRHFLGLGISLFLAVPRWRFARCATRLKRYRQFTIAPPRRQSILWHWLSQKLFFFGLAAASAFLNLMQSMVAVLLSIVAALAFFALVLMLVCASASVLFVFAFVAAALRGPGSVMIWHIVSPYVFDICYYRKHITLSAYVNNKFERSFFSQKRSRYVNSSSHSVASSIWKTLL